MGLLKFQEEPACRVTEILKTKGSALDASSTGVGKTYVAIHAAIRLDVPVGIVCPKSVIPMWQRVCDSEGLKPVFIMNYEKIIRGENDYVIRDKKDFMWHFAGLIIWDEVHRCKGMATLNSRLLRAAWKTDLIRCLCLSATAAQSPLEMRALGYVLGLHKDYNFYHWIQKNGAVKNRFNGFDWRGKPGQLEEIHKQIFPDRGVRVRISDLGNQFPDNLVIAEPMEMEDAEELARTYEDAAKALDELKAQQEIDYPSAFTIILRARQKAELLKVPLLTEMTEDLLDEGKSVVVFCNFNETLNQLSSILKTDCLVRGEQSLALRQQNVDDFQSNKSRVILCNIQAGGTGLSFHDTDGGHPRVALHCPSYNAVDLKQALGRVHRAGGKTPTIQRLVYAAGTIEEKVCQSVRAKLDRIELLNDNELSGGISWDLIKTGDRTQTLKTS